MVLHVPLLATLLFASDSARVAPNDNRAPAGRLRRGVLTLELDAARMGPGETYDFELTPSAPSDLTLLAVVRGRANRVWQIRLPIRVR